MKKLLLVLGIAVIIVGIIAFLFSALHRQLYYHVLDGDADMYIRFHRRMIVFFVSGIVLEVIGAVCVIIRVKL